MTAKFPVLIAGNWKMNGVAATLPELQAMASGVKKAETERVQALICLPSTLMSRGAETVRGSSLAIGGQDCHFAEHGAHTGDVSAAQLRDAGASYVILGHSERRSDHHETDALIRKKVKAAWAAGLRVILCVGETVEQREQGQALKIVEKQCEASIPDDSRAENLVIAYEPVWAIGTGKVPTLGDVAEMHDFIRVQLQQRFGSKADGIRVLYGGSVKPDNASDLLSVPHVHGALIGGASLLAADFLAIFNAAIALK